jgi:DNA modification methylase
LALLKEIAPSVYHSNYRSVYTDDYPAKFDDELARMLIRLYTEPGEIVCDPMAGSGIIPLVAASLHRNAIYQDVNKLAWDLFENKKNPTMLIVPYLQDARIKIGTGEKNYIDLILFSPPFGLTIDDAHDKYSDAPDDIANSKTYDKWRDSMAIVINQCFKVLKPGKFNDSRNKSRA